MLSLKALHPAQDAAITHIYETGQTYLVGQMGSGKTVVMLTAAAELLRDGVVKRVLVVSTSKIVRDVWPNEPGKWVELNYLTDQIGVLTGAQSVTQRKKILASDLPIICINFEMLPWLFAMYGSAHSFDMLAVDEVTKLKAGGTHFKALRPRLKDFTVRVVATGTPVEENWLGLFYPMMVCDGGAALGRNNRSFRLSYFYPTDYQAYNWALQPGASERIMRACRASMVVLPDYTHELPEVKEQLVRITLPEKVLQRYRTLALSAIDAGAEVAASNAAVLTGKLQQLASGFLYSSGEGERQTTEIHDLKIPALLAKSHDVACRLWVYSFEEERRRLAAHVPGVLFLDGTDDARALAAWRGGQVRDLALHPDSAGHGLDLTTAEAMLVCSPLWSRDKMRQVIARMVRRGQKKATAVYIAVALSTIDEEIVEREKGKAAHHALFQKHWRELSAAG